MKKKITKKKWLTQIKHKKDYLEMERGRRFKKFEYDEKGLPSLHPTNRR
jgi:hypothetical protein